MTLPAPRPEDLVATLASRPGPDLVLVTGTSGTGKTRWCERLAGAARAAGLRVAGLVSPALLEAGRKSAIDLVDLATGSRRRLAVRPAAGEGGTAGLGWRFEEATLAWGNEVLATAGPCDLLVVDELGPLELGCGTGLTAAFDAVATRSFRLAVVVVRPELLEAARARLGPDAGTFEPAEAPATGPAEAGATILDVDFGRLYRDHLAASGREAKPPEAWDGRVADLARTAGESLYVAEFVRRMDLEGCATLLDVGCGPGAIALAVADRLEHVYGLDYSRSMLDALVAGAAARGLSNVVPIERSWEGDWSDVPACDVVVASRSTLVSDLADALARLDAKAKKRVYLTSLAGGGFLERELLEAVGRARPPLPDYIYVVNLLHRMGRHPRLDYIRGDRRPAAPPSWDSLLRRVEFALGALGDDERDRLEAFYRSDPERACRGGARRWAFVSWETTEPPEPPRPAGGRHAR